MPINPEIVNIISEIFGIEPDKITIDTDFYNDLNADKVEVADLLLKVQAKLNIEIPEENFNQVNTVADLIKLIEIYSDEI